MANFGKAFDEAFRPADVAATSGAYDVIKQKILTDQKKATDTADATTINHAAIAAAIASGDKDLMKNTALMVDSIGNTTPEASKLIFTSIQDRIKAQATQQKQEKQFMLTQGMQPTDTNSFNKAQVEAGMSSNPNPAPPISVGGTPYAPIPGFETTQQTNSKSAQENRDINTWNKNVVAPSDPYKASSRSTLGMASNGNLRADRALALLAQPTVTPQSLSAIVGDYSGIIQGGAPTDQIMRDSDYKNMVTKLASIQQVIDSAPKNGLTSKLKEYLVKQFTDLKSVNNNAIKAHVDYMESSNKKLIEKFPDEWAGIKKSLLGQTGSSQEVPMPSRASAPKGAKGWNKKTGQWVM